MAQASSAMRVLVVGPVPPPHGGVAVFVQRLQAALLARGVYVRVLNPLAGGRGAFGQVTRGLTLFPMFFNRLDVVHDNIGPYLWQSAAGRALYALLLDLSGKPVVLSVHQGRFPEVFADLPPGVRAAVRRILRKLRLVVSDNKAIRDFLLREGVAEERVVVLPSFVPFADAVDAPLPPDVEEFLQSHAPLIAVPGYTYSPVYNFDAVLRVTAAMRDRFPRLGVQLVVSRFVLDPVHKDYVLRLRRELGLEECVSLVSDIPELLPLFRRVDVVLRSTSSDGSSLSVLEALYVGTPVVATDCCERPRGTIVFPVGDWEAARQRLVALLEAPPPRAPNPWVREEAERVLDELVAGYRRAAGR